MGTAPKAVAAGPRAVGRAVVVTEPKAAVAGPPGATEFVEDIAVIELVSIRTSSRAPNQGGGATGE